MNDIKTVRDMRVELNSFSKEALILYLVKQLFPDHDLIYALRMAELDIQLEKVHSEIESLLEKSEACTRDPSPQARVEFLRLQAEYDSARTHHDVLLRQRFL